MVTSLTPFSTGLFSSVPSRLVAISAGPHPPLATIGHSLEWMQPLTNLSLGLMAKTEFKGMLAAGNKPFSANLVPDGNILLENWMTECTCSETPLNRKQISLKSFLARTPQTVHLTPSFKTWTLKIPQE